MKQVGGQTHCKNLCSMKQVGGQTHCKKKTFRFFLENQGTDK